MSNLIDLNIKNLLQKAVAILIQNKIESPTLESELLLAHVLGLPRFKVVLNNNQSISEDKMIQFMNLIRKKSTGMPTAYLLGYQEFYGRNFDVNPAVLIPRPETEELVEWILQENKNCANVLDMCCGSGCIGVTLSLEIMVRNLYLSDVSLSALEVARKNAGLTNKNSSIQFIQGYLFNNIAVNDFDLIVSNPPYVTKEEYILLDNEVKNYEPEQALLLEKPNEFNLNLIQSAFNHLKIGGKFYLETNPVFIEFLIKTTGDSGFKEVHVKKDISGKNRFLSAVK